MSPYLRALRVDQSEAGVRRVLWCGWACRPIGRNKLRPSRARTPRAEGGAGTSHAELTCPRYQVCPKPLMARMSPPADTDDTDCVRALIRQLASVYIRDGEAASVTSVVSLLPFLPRNTQKHPSGDTEEAMKRTCFARTGLWCYGVGYGMDRHSDLSAP